MFWLLIPYVLQPLKRQKDGVLKSTVFSDIDGVFQPKKFFDSENNDGGKCA